MRFKMGIAIYQTKLFSRAIIAHHKILILFKEHFTINKRRSSVRIALQFKMVCTILDAAVFVFFRIILDDAIICMDKHTRISSFFKFWAK